MYCQDLLKSAQSGHTDQFFLFSKLMNALNKCFVEFSLQLKFAKVLFLIYREDSECNANSHYYCFSTVAHTIRLV